MKGVDLQPAKWLKYLKLVEYDLISVDELKRDVFRYPVGRVHYVREELRRALREDQKRGARNLYVLKLVRLNQVGRLPNLRVTSEEDLDEFEAFVKQLSSVHEVWYCRTRIDPGVFSVAGRISICYRNLPRAHLIEQVWRCSPRLIETFGSNFPYPYARASRVSWGRHYDIECWHRGGSLYAIASVAQEGEFLRSLLTIERKRKSLERFLDMIEGMMIESVSLEYKIVGSELSIIDWDTADDRRILGI
ncbi:MAG TPA: hypothetical protein VHR45_20850 [Thermoanaerobaculia bacterium]|nr:hypothetical protein [Thermoanaerobaculia bacterium]